MPDRFRRGFVVLVMVALLFVPVAAFADDGHLQPPIGSQGQLQPPIGAQGELQPPIGAHAVTQPSHSAGFLDLLLVWFEALI